MEDPCDRYAGTGRGLILRGVVVALTASLIVSLPLGSSAQTRDPCVDGRRGDVQCDVEKREDSERDNDSDGEDQRKGEPEKGDTRDEYRYRKCTLDDEKDIEDADSDEPICYVGDADSPVGCDDDEAWYWVDVRVWTYDGSEWQYDETVGDNGWDSQGPQCVNVGEIITEDVVIQAINSRQLPVGDVGMNPPNGRTLVGEFKTIFFSEQGREEFTLPLEEVNVDVEVIATPISYNWDFGDGNTAEWKSKGRAWERDLSMSDYNTHRYSETGNFEVELTIDYEVQYNDGASWQTISDPITSRPSEPYEVEVVKNKNVLRDGD